MPGHSAHREELCKSVDFVLVRDAAFDLQAKALAGISVYDRQLLQLAAARRPVEHEVPAQHVIRRLSPPSFVAIGTRAQTTLCSVLFSPFQILPLPQPKQTRQAQSCSARRLLSGK